MQMGAAHFHVRHKGDVRHKGGFAPLPLWQKAKAAYPQGI
jgi:hypothetical protein